MKDEKCRFFNTCPLVDPKGYTCLHEEEASSGYCGQYKVNERFYDRPLLRWFQWRNR